MSWNKMGRTPDFAEMPPEGELVLLRLEDAMSRNAWIGLGRWHLGRSLEEWNDTETNPYVWMANGQTIEPIRTDYVHVVAWHVIPEYP